MCSQGVSLCCAAVHVERRPLNDSQLVEGHSGWQGTTPRDATTASGMVVVVESTEGRRTKIPERTQLRLVDSRYSAA